jgi:hypothetical protein
MRAGPRSGGIVAATSPSLATRFVVSPVARHIASLRTSLLLYLLLVKLRGMLKFSFLLALALLCSACNSGSPSGGTTLPPTPAYTTFDPPGSSTGHGALLFCMGYGTYPQDINSSGTIVVYFLDSNQTSHGFIRSPDGTLAVVDAPNVGTSCAHGTWIAAVNSSGTSTGSASTGFSTIDKPANSEAFTLTRDGQFNILYAPTLGPAATSSASINDTGAIVGSFLDLNLYVHAFTFVPSVGFRSWEAPGVILSQPGSGTVFSRINNNGDIIGTFDGAGFLLQADGTFVILSAAVGGTVAYNLNSKTELVGGYYNGSTSQSFLRNPDGVYTIFNPPGVGPLGSQAVSINNAGTVAGNFTDANSIPHGYLFNTDGTFTIIDAPDALQAPASGTTITRINDSGVVIGYFLDAQNAPHGFVRQ